jgi:hypothetical protein
VRTPTRDYFLHLSHGVEMPLTEMEVQGTREECVECAVVVHTGDRRYLVVVPGNLSCTRGGGSQLICFVVAKMCNLKSIFYKFLINVEYNNSGFDKVLNVNI